MMLFMLRCSSFAVLAVSAIFGGPAVPDEIPSRASFPDVADEDWNRMAARTRWAPDDLTALRIINRLSNISEENWDRYARHNRRLAAEVFAQPQQTAGTVLRLRGIATRCVKVNLDADWVDQFNFDSYHLVEIDVDDPKITVVVVTTSVPASWQQAPTLSQRVACAGCFLMSGVKDGQPRPVLATGHLQWYPAEVHRQLGIAASHVLLAQNGFDVGLLESLRHNSSQAFAPEEQMVLREFLKAIELIDRDTRPLTGSPWNLLDSIQYPDKYMGSLVNVSGTVRRITPVIIESPEMRRELGIDRYYQLDVFLPMGYDSLTIQDHEKPGNPQITFRGKFGITVILSQLPAGLSESQVSNPLIKVPCFYLKQWQHVTLASRDLSPNIKKQNPILVGLPSRVVVVHPAPPSNIGQMAAAFFALLLVALIGLVLWTRTHQSRARQRDLKYSPEFNRLPEQGAAPTTRSTDRSGEPRPGATSD